MLLQQVCPGKTSASYQSIHLASYDGQRYILYGATDTAVICDASFRPIQILFLQHDSHEEENQMVSALAMSEFDGKIAVTTRRHVLIYGPETGKTNKPRIMSICAIIDPNQWLVSQQQSASQYPIHALDGMEFLMAVEYAESHAFDRDSDVQGIRLRKLQELAQDTSDLFFQIQGDGSMIIWGVQALRQKS
ncbi:hypothetical protein DFQ26_003412 [Actinomortierella ambigua]|nr:hypothetical protein DFQ26_003412 [Actinomortierella ambigua]